MTTQKVQSKIKSSTIAITVLSILLAVAVASTIVLAAFAQTKTVNTTLTFGGGLTLTLSGTSNNDFTYAADTGNNSITITSKAADGFTANAVMPAIEGATNIDAYAGYKITVTATDRASDAVTMTAGADNKFTASDSSGLTVTVAPGSNFAQDATNKDCWVNTASALNATATAMISSITIGAENIDSIMGYGVSITITFFAEDAQTATAQTIVAGLNA